MLIYSRSLQISFDKKIFAYGFWFNNTERDNMVVYCKKKLF